MLSPRASLALGLWLLALLVIVLVLERPAPLFINLGAGDAPFARGFRGGWERDGLRQTGETMFRWTTDGARLEFPVEVRSGRLAARLRLARFADGAAEITLLAGERVVDHWVQPPRGWSVRTVELGELRAALALRFRSTSPEAESLGVALDWVEVRGAGEVWPERRVLAGLAVFLLGVPALLGLLARRVLPALVAGGAVAAAGAIAIHLDRLGGLVALASAAVPACLALLVLDVVFIGLRRAWPDLLAEAAFWIPAGAVLLALVALSHPFYYYPDVDTHARYLAAIRTDPYLAWDPTEYQTRVGAWTREIAGRRIAFPYSPALHLLAWPAATLLGETAAIKTVAAIALGVTLVLVHALSRALRFALGAALTAQAVLVLLPVTSSRLVLALYPTLLGQALELLLLLHLARRLPHLTGARDTAAAAFFLLLAQLAYTGSLLNVAALLAILSALEALSGERRRALRLLAGYAVATALVICVQYGGFLPVLWRDVLPHALEAPSPAGAEAGGSAGVLATAMGRLWFFYDLVHPLLLLAGLVALRGAPSHARRVVLAVLLAGIALLALRYAAPAVFRDAKEVELLAAPVAALSAAGLGWLGRRGVPGRVAAAVAGLYALGWGAGRAVSAYAERFLAVGR